MHASTHDCASTPRPGPKGAAHELPLLSPRDSATFNSTQRAGVVSLVVAAHGALGWSLLQLEHVRATVADTAPILVEWVAARAEVAHSLPHASAPVFPLSAQPPRPAAKSPAPTAAAPLLSAPETPQPARLVADPAPAPQPAAHASPLASVEAAPAPAPALHEPEPTPAPPAPTPPAPLATPRELPASAVQYLEPPMLEYPRAARRAGESGRVLVRVQIDEGGVPRQPRIQQSSGFVRLDDAALAAVHKARFKPYVENGRAIAGWALIPLAFDLEK